MADSNYSTLRSAVYHKCAPTPVAVFALSLTLTLPLSRRPTQAFIAGGKLGADQISAQRTENQHLTREAALATLVAGNKAENVRLPLFSFFSSSRAQRRLLTTPACENAVARL